MRGVNQMVTARAAGNQRYVRMGWREVRSRASFENSASSSVVSVKSLLYCSRMAATRCFSSGVSKARAGMSSTEMDSSLSFHGTR